MKSPLHRSLPSIMTSPETPVRTVLPLMNQPLADKYKDNTLVTPQYSESMFLSPQRITTEEKGNETLTKLTHSGSGVSFLFIFLSKCYNHFAMQYTIPRTVTGH